MEYGNGGGEVALICKLERKMAEENSPYFLRVARRSLIWFSPKRKNA